MSAREFDRLAQDATILSRDEFGPKVMLLPDQRVIKLFRRKRLLSSTLLRPYAIRFADASRRLRQLAIPAPEVIAAYRVRDIARDIVVYRRLEGTPLRDVVQDDRSRDAALERFAQFIAKLHDRGVYFRGIHFGNVLVQPDDSLALIDLSEARFGRRPLGLSRRVRNFRPLLRDREDAGALAAFGGRRWLETYCEAARIDEVARARLRSRTARLHPVLAEANVAAPALGGAP